MALWESPDRAERRVTNGRRFVTNGSGKATCAAPAQRDFIAELDGLVVGRALRARLGDGSPSSAIRRPRSGRPTTGNSRKQLIPPSHSIYPIVF